VILTTVVEKSEVVSVEARDEAADASGVGMILWEELEKVTFFQASFSVEDKSEAGGADQRGNAAEEDGPSEGDQDETGVKRMADDGIDSMLDELGIWSRCWMRCPVGAESADAGDAKCCTKKNENRSDSDSERVERAGSEQWSEEEDCQSQEVLCDDPAMVFRGGGGGAVLLVGHRLIVTDRGMDCE
jgi:hypothetical protein